MPLKLMLRVAAGKAVELVLVGPSDNQRSCMDSPDITLSHRKKQHLTDFVCLTLSGSYEDGIFGFSSGGRGRQSIL